MGTATDELRRLLDERGVKYRDYFNSNKTWWSGRENVGWYAEDRPSANGLYVKIEAVLTPEQAIAATLGRGECRNISKVVDKYGQARFACSECGAWLDSRMLWNPEYPNGESPWVKDCKLNYCPNCGRKIVK